LRQAQADANRRVFKALFRRYAPAARASNPDRVNVGDKGGARLGNTLGTRARIPD